MAEIFAFSSFTGKDIRERWANAMAMLRMHPGATLLVEPGTYEVGTALSRKTMEDVFSGALTKQPEPIMFNPNFAYDVGLAMDDLRDVTIDARGATLLIDGFMEPVSLIHSQHVTLRGLTIDHKRKPYSTGRVVSCVPGEKGSIVTVRFFDHCPVREEMPGLRWALYDPYANRFVHFGEFSVDEWHLTASQTIELQTSEILPYDPCGLELNMWHTFHYRPAIHLFESKDITLDGVTIHSQPGMGVVAHRCDGLTFQGLRVIPSAGEHISTNTDATHITSTKGKVVFRGCSFEGQGDDSVNIHSYYHAIMECSGADCQVTNLAPTGTHDQRQDIFEIGDKLELTDPNSLAAAGQYTVTRCQLLPDGRSMALTLDRPLPENAKGLLFSDITLLPEQFVFSGNVCRNHIARSVLVKIKNALVEDNTFIDVDGTAIYIAAESWWYEGLCTTENIQIRRNRIIHCADTAYARKRQCGGICVSVDAEAPKCKTHRYVEITDNIIDCPDTKIGLYVSNAEKAVLLRNQVRSAETPVVIEDVPTVS